ncbi:hypothetical protein OROMI_029226 [Orobanche minor]
MTSQGSGTSEGKFGFLKSFRSKLPEVKLANIAGVMFTVGGVVIMTVTNSMTDSALKMLSAKVSDQKPLRRPLGKRELLSLSLPIRVLWPLRMSGATPRHVGSTLFLKERRWRPIKLKRPQIKLKRPPIKLECLPIKLKLPPRKQKVARRHDSEDLPPKIVIGTKRRLREHNVETVLRNITNDDNQVPKRLIHGENVYKVLSSIVMNDHTFTRNCETKCQNSDITNKINATTVIKKENTTLNSTPNIPYVVPSLRRLPQVYLNLRLLLHQTIIYKVLGQQMLANFEFEDYMYLLHSS